MNAAAKNPISSLIPTAAQPVPGVILHDSGTPIRIVDLKEARQLSRFVPVIVLLPASPANSTSGASPHGGDSKSAGETPGPVKLLELFGKAMKQSKARSDDGDFAFGDVKVSFSSMEASRKGEPVMLTALEFKTLKYLAQNARRVISRDELLNEVWGYENYPCTRTVDNHILRLRQKLEKNPSRPVHFRTVHGAGYKFLPQGSTS
jgi:DNA-binding winged helix-turn-helix (wHTH) protein